MLTIYLVRHGQDKDNANGILNGWRDEELTEIGINQANELALKIKDSNIVFDHIYSSPLKRALKTAETIGYALNVKVNVLKDLIERNFGIFTGEKIENIVKLCKPEDLFKTETINYFIKAQDSEDFPDLISRANKLLEELKEKHSNGNILLVSHGDFGKMIYAAYYKLDWKDTLSLFHFGNSEMIKLSEDSKFDDVHVFKTEQYNP